MKDTLIEILGVFGAIIYFAFMIALNAAFTILPFYILFKYIL